MVDFMVKIQTERKIYPLDFVTRLCLLLSFMNQKRWLNLTVYFLWFID